MPRRLDTLTPGERFITESGRKGTLLRLYAGSALVVYDGKRKKRFEAHDKEGNTIEVEFEDSKGLTVSRGTMVQKLLPRKKKKKGRPVKKGRRKG